MNDINPHLGQLAVKTQSAEFRSSESHLFDYITYAIAVICILFAGKFWYFQKI